MTPYAGQTLHIKATVKRPNGAYIVDTDAPEATITIYDKRWVLLTSHALVWAEDESAWVYDYTAAGSGVHNILCRFTDPDGHYDTWAFQRLRVRANPVPVA